MTHLPTTFPELKCLLISSLYTEAPKAQEAAKGFDAVTVKLAPLVPRHTLRLTPPAPQQRMSARGLLKLLTPRGLVFRTLP